MVMFWFGSVPHTAYPPTKGCGVGQALSAEVSSVSAVQDDPLQYCIFHPVDGFFKFVKKSIMEILETDMPPNAELHRFIVNPTTSFTCKRDDTNETASLWLLH